MAAYSQYLRIGVHAMASDREVLKQCHTLLTAQAKRSHGMRETRHKWLREMLHLHHEAQAMHVHILLGQSGGTC